MGESTASNEIKENVKKFMKNEVLKLSPPFPASIYKVPKELRNGHHKIFDPVSVPIGPLHYDDSCPAQQVKLWCLKNFIDRYEDKEESLDVLAECMTELEPEVRQCYKGIDENKVGEEQLVKVMLLDGCFIMELFWNMDETSNNSNNNVIDMNDDVDQRRPFETVLDAVPFLTLQQDLLKIENQLPFIVLMNLTRLAPEDVKRKMNKLPVSNKKRDNNLDHHYLIRLALNFFDISTPEKTYATTTPRHLLELVMNALFHNNTPSSVSINMQKNNNDNDNYLITTKSASDLEFYGITFRATDSRNMANIRFSSGELRMPKLHIQESTLWNFLIFEMLSCMTRTVSSYVVLMGELINNEKDVEVLLSSKILASRGSDAKTMVSMFTELSATVNKKNFCFGQLLNEINAYCETNYRKMRAKFVRKYYDSRWEVLNNTLLFTLTFTQTLFSVLGYNPKSKGTSNNNAMLS